MATAATQIHSVPNRRDYAEISEELMFLHEERETLAQECVDTAAELRQARATIQQLNRSSLLWRSVAGGAVMGLGLLAVNAAPLPEIIRAGWPIVFWSAALIFVTWWQMLFHVGCSVAAYGEAVLWFGTEISWLFKMFRWNRDFKWFARRVGGAVGEALVTRSERAVQLREWMTQSRYREEEV